MLYKKICINNQTFIVLKPIFENIPEELRILRQWVNWKLELDKNGRSTKVPYQINGQKADSTNQSTWSGFDDVISAYNKHDFAGIGFVVTVDRCIIGIDLDHCVNDDAIDPWALDIAQKLNSYTEKSPSGNGLRIFIRGKIDDQMRKKRSGFGSDGNGAVEIYQEKRFLTVTGHRLDQYSKKVENRIPEVNGIYEAYLKPESQKANNATTKNHKSQSSISELPDEEVIRRASNAQNNEKFKELFSGDTSGYGSQSEADLALCAILAFWTGKNKPQMDRIFRKSGLYRDKWDEMRGDKSYGEITMDKAIEGTKDVFDPSKKEGQKEDVPEHISDKANEILRNGNPVNFIINSFNRMHIGDEITAKYLLASVISQQVENTKGIQPKTHGRSTGGKTHCAEIMAHHMPKGAIKEMTVSAKALYYEDNLQERTVIFSDDVSMSDDLEGTLKRTMSNFTKKTTHKTVDKGSAVTKEIPPRIIWWLTSVGDSFSEELNNRLVGLSVDDDPATDKLVFEHQKKQAASGQSDLIEDEDVQVCREMIRIIRDEELFTVVIPFAEDIQMTHTENRRNFPRFLDLIRVSAVLHFMQRAKNENGNLLASEEDFKFALGLYTPRAESLMMNMSDKQLIIAKFIMDNPGRTIKELAEMGIEYKGKTLQYQDIYNNVIGRKKVSESEYKGGIIQKIPELHRQDDKFEFEDGFEFESYKEPIKLIKTIA